MTGGLLSSSPPAPCPCPVPEPPPLLQVASTSAVSTVSILRLARDPRRSIEGGGLNAIVSAESPRLLAAQTRRNNRSTSFECQPMYGVVIVRPLSLYM